MAILNCTPDSFYDGGLYFDEQNAIKRALEQEQEGADIIDIGGESTRPYSKPVPVSEEIRRIKTVIRELHKCCRATLSIDSSKAEVVQVALDEGATFINDVTGFRDPALRLLAKQYNATLCVMHMQKSPHDMQVKPFYPRGVVTEVYEWLQQQLTLLVTEGIKPEKIYLDVGIGFGKSLDDNLCLLKNLEKFTSLQAPLLIGLSRKSFMQKILNKSGSELLSTTLALNTMSLLKGVEIIRVHDVKEHKEILTVLARIDNLR